MNSPTIMASGTQMGTIIGTAAYMAPEQAMGRHVDTRADIWAFGVVLFEMLAGKPLFAGDTLSETIAAVLREDIDWTALPTTTPDRIRQLLARCLHRDVRQRLQASARRGLRLIRRMTRLDPRLRASGPHRPLRERRWSSR